MPDPGVDAQEFDVVGDGQLTDHLRGLADQLEQVIAAAERGRHLIHHPAGRADDEVLHLLREERDLAIGERGAQERRHRLQRRHLQRRGRAQPFADRHLRPDRQPEPVPERLAELGLQDDQRAGSVGGPRAPRIGGQQGVGARVVERPFRNDLRERQPHRGFAAQRANLVALDHDLGFVARLRRHPGRGGDRQLQHQGARVVGDPAHDVEASRGARDRDGTAPVEELPVDLDLGHRRHASASRPRVRIAARKAGSTCDRMAALA